MRIDARRSRPTEGLTLLLVGSIALLGAIAVRDGLLGAGAEPATLTPDDLARMGVAVEPVASTQGLRSRDEILVLAREVYDPPDPQAKVEPFLYAVTDPSSLRSDRPLRRTPVWIVHYSGLTTLSPGGKELHHTYYMFDAQTGEFLRGRWSP
jgi:hypothetical protein